MHARRHRPVLIVLGACAVVAAACGQRSGVHVATGVGGRLGGGASSGQAVGAGAQTSATGESSGGGTGSGGGGTSGTSNSGAVTGGSTGGTSSGTGSSTGGGSAAGGTSGGGGGTSASGGGTAAGPGDTTGVTDTEIRIGIHAPVTGAAPFPVTSFQNGAHLYFEHYLNQRGGVNGRKVTVFFEDDQYNPSSAVAVCKKMVQEDHVFMLVGGGGADQIVACAQYAASVGVPYVAEGVAEAALQGNSAYFALTETYKQQGLVLAEYIKNVLHKTKVAMIRADTDNFNDAHDGFKAAAAQLGLQCSCDLTIPKDAGTSEDAAAASQLKGTGADVVYPLMAPTLFLNMAAQAHAQLYNPRWAGVGITLGLNTVAQVACGSGSFQGGASFFSPAPGLDQVDALDPAYNQAYQATYGQQGDDIGLLLWGAEKELGQMLGAAGKSLSRQSFVAAVNGKRFHTGLYPDVDYGPSRFGGTGVQVLLANCSKQKFDTQYTFKSSF